MKRWRAPVGTSSAIAVGLLAALLAIVLLVEARREPPPEKEGTPTPLPLLNISIEELQSLHISDGERALHIEHESDGGSASAWRITALQEGAATRGATAGGTPTSGIADPYPVHLAADDLLHLKAQRVLLEQTTDLAQYGLDPVSLSLIAITRSGQEERINVGRQTPDGVSYYLQRPGDPRLYLVAQYTLQPFFNWLDAPPLQPTPTPS